jgi:hypothetical protein
MLSHTNKTKIAVEWTALASLQAPGSDITGYRLQMRDSNGLFSTVFDGSDLYPDLRQF